MVVIIQDCYLDRGPQDSIVTGSGRDSPANGRVAIGDSISTPRQRIKSERLLYTFNIMDMFYLALILGPNFS
jgi:hypothetical protein